MAFEGFGIKLPGLVSGATALSGAQYKFVQINSSGKIIAAATAGQKGVVGVLQNKPVATDDAAEVVAGGITKVLAGCPITAGQALVSDASGLAISAAATASHFINGRALESATAANDIISMVFAHEGPNGNDL